MLHLLEHDEKALLVRCGVNECRNAFEEAQPAGFIFNVHVDTYDPTIIEEDGTKISVPRGATISRVTVVIDKKGNIAYKASPAKAGEDSKKIEAVVKKLTD